MRKLTLLDLVFLMAILGGYIGYIIHVYTNTKVHQAPIKTACPASEPCTLQRCTGLTGIAEFLGNYFLCENWDSERDWCYGQQNALCQERCHLLLTKNESKSRPVLSDADLTVIQVCEAVCKNQLDIFKTTKAFKAKQCEWETPAKPDKIYYPDQESLVELNTVVINKGRKCWETRYGDDNDRSCLVCVGEKWEHVTFDYRAGDPFKERPKPLVVTILDIKEGWVKVSRSGGFPEDNGRTTIPIHPDESVTGVPYEICLDFDKIQK